MTYFPLTKPNVGGKEQVADLAQRELAHALKKPTGQASIRRRAWRHCSAPGCGDYGVPGARWPGADLLTTCLIVEELSKHCPSTAMCYKMHLEAAEIICRIPTPYQVEHFVKPMAQGQVFTTIAGSESWGRGITGVRARMHRT